MKTMKNFAAQQLMKQQMNDVMGGLVSVGCTIKDQDGRLVEMLRTAHGATLQEAMDGMLSSLGSNNAHNFKVFNV